MMKKMILFASVIFLLSSCSKDNKSTNNSGNTWTFGNTTYTGTLVTYVNAGDESNLASTATGYTATSSNSIIFTFINPPTSSGQIPITNSADPNTVMVSTSNLTGTTTTFYDCDVTGVMASVTISGGKISVTFPGKIWLHNIQNFNDSAQVSVGTITQQ
jgi:hypothetical protein